LRPPRRQRGWQHLQLAGVGAVLVWSLLVAAPAGAQEAQRLNDAAARLTAEGRYEEALPLLSRAHDLSPGDPVIRTNLATLRTVLGHRALARGAADAAREQYRAALALVPDEPAALLGLGDAELRRREPGLALEAYGRALALKPGEPETYLRLGEAYYQLGDLARATSAWEQGLALRPDHAALRRRLAQARAEGRIEGGYAARLSQHFDLRYEGARNEAVGQEVLDILEGAYREVGYWLGYYPRTAISVTLYSEQDFQAVTGHPHWAGATYSNFDGRIRVAIRGVNPGDPEMRQRLFHEYTHAVVYGLTGGNIPTWLNEGLAVAAEGSAGGRTDGYLAGARVAARQGQLIPLTRLGGSFLGMSSTRTVALAYAESYAATQFLLDRYGTAAVGQLLRRLGSGQAFPAAAAETLGSPLEQVEAAWHAWLQQ
jgi:hypothetical protein